MATVPWRAPEAEAVLRGNPFSEENRNCCGGSGVPNGERHGHNDFKIGLGKRTLCRALLEAAALGDLKMTNEAAPVPKANMGAPVPRYEARLKVTGEARYPGDVSLTNPAYAVLVTSAIAKGRIKDLNLDNARAVSGVLEILTHENTAELKQVKFGRQCSTSIQDLGPEIRHDGQIVAMVVADTFEAATEAAHAVSVTYAEEAPSATFGSSGLKEEDATTVSAQHRHMPGAGDAGSAIAAAEVTIDVEYATPAQHHNPIELFSTTCLWTDDRLTIYEPSQFVYGLKNNVAERLGIEPERCGPFRVTSAVRSVRRAR